MNIIVIGNIETGSSAVLDLLSEYSSCSFGLRPGYEHMVFCAPGSLFHLRDNLFAESADLFSQDSDFQSFLVTMSRLYKLDFGWFGGYKKMLGEPFKDSYLSFVNAVTRTVNCLSYSHYRGVFLDPVKAVGQLILGRKRNLYGVREITDRKPIFELTVDKTTFDFQCKEFIKRYFDFCQSGNQNTIFDHVLWPKDTSVWASFFPDNTKIINVERDPRDIFLYYKHTQTKSSDMYPLDPEGFASVYSKLREPAVCDGVNILTIHLEDLVMHYADTVSRIESFLSLRKIDHIKPLTNFVPEKSLGNVGIYLRKSVYVNEVAAITKKLGSSLYRLSAEDEKRIGSCASKPF